MAHTQRGTQISASQTGSQFGPLSSQWNWVDAAYLEPSHVEEELEDGEDGHVEVDVMAGVPLRRVQELLSEHRAQKERVNS